MKCPIDQTEMEKGVLPTAAYWRSGANDIKSMLEKEMSAKLIAYKCPKCGKIELTTEEEEKKINV